MIARCGKSHLAFALALLLALVLGPAGTSAGGQANGPTVTAKPNNIFVPDEVAVTPGGTVNFRNEGGGLHDVAWDDGHPTDPPSPSTASWTTERTFQQPGAYAFYCTVHGGPGGAGMSGTVYVNDSGTIPDTDPPVLSRGLAIGVRRGYAFAYRSNEPALTLARVFVRPAAGGSVRLLGTLPLYVSRAGFNVRRVLVGLVPGTYYVVIRARDAARNVTPRALIIRFTVR